MRTEKKFNHLFIIREGDECKAIWEGDPSKCPNRLITFQSSDSQDGLMWETWEDFWVEYGLHPEELDAKRLLATLLAHIMNNQHQGPWKLSQDERLALIAKLADTSHEDGN